MSTCWNLLSPAPDPPQTLLLCRVPHCPRWGRPSVYTGTGTTTGPEGSLRRFLPQSGSRLDRRSPCPPGPRSRESDTPAQTAAWSGRPGRSCSSPSPDEDERYPPASSFRLWWILQQDQNKCYFKNVIIKILCKHKDKGCHQETAAKITNNII